MEGLMVLCNREGFLDGVDVVLRAVVADGLFEL